MRKEGGVRRRERGGRCEEEGGGGLSMGWEVTLLGATLLHRKN